MTDSRLYSVSAKQTRTVKQQGPIDRAEKFTNMPRVSASRSMIDISLFLPVPPEESDAAKLCPITSRSLFE